RSRSPAGYSSRLVGFRQYGAFFRLIVGDRQGAAAAGRMMVDPLSIRGGDISMKTITSTALRKTEVRADRNRGSEWHAPRRAARDNEWRAAARDNEWRAAR